MNDPQDRWSEDPLFHAEGAFEEHERELAEQLLTRVQRDIPKEATIGEAVAEINRAAAEDGDAHELLLRIVAIQRQNPGGYLHSYFGKVPQPPDVDRQYQLAGPSFSSETLELWGRLSSEVEKRLPPYRTEAEREALVEELLAEDRQLREDAVRLGELFLHDGYFRPPGGQKG